jgi:hypothetical protein
MPVKRLSVILLIMFLRQPVFAQRVNDSVFVARLSQNMKRVYPSFLIREAPVFNGKIYHPDQRPLDNGHPFYISSDYVDGTISTNGFVYTNLKIAYDLVRNQLTILHFDGVSSIIVPPDHVDSFSLHNHKFINLRLAADSTLQLKEGYYNLLYDGSVDLLVKRTKTISEKITPLRVERLVSQQDKYYLKSESAITLIKNKKALLNLLRSTKGENERFIKDNHLNFKGDKENAFLKLVQFHDSAVAK